VRLAVPPSLKGSSSSMSSKFKVQTLNPQDIVDRFFNSIGRPTNLFDILQGVDDRIESINSRWSQFSGCMSNTPTAYSLGTSFASSPTFYAQCSETWSSGSGFDQWSQIGDTTYLYVRGGDGIVAAQVVGNGTFGNVKQVTVWFSVGIVNRNGSHAVAMVYAEPSTPIFEMSVAGNNVGFCGVQMKSDGHVLNVTGSEGINSCAPTDTSCTLASSLTTEATCNAFVDSFSLPAMGREAYSGNEASAYPGGSKNTVVLANTGTDATFFGPSVPTV